MTVELGQIALVAALLTAISLGLFPLIGTYTNNQRMISLASSAAMIQALLVAIAFGILTAVALAEVGYFGIFEPHFQSWGPAQVFFDLVIVAVLGCIWMIRDARTRGRTVWPFLLLTLTGGSFGILFYLILREVQTGGAPATAAVQVR